MYLLFYYISEFHRQVTIWFNGIENNRVVKY